MHLASLLHGLVVGLAIFLGLPYLLVVANEMFMLPVLYHPIMQVFGVSFVTIGAIIFTYCSGLFALLGRGTPIPIDPPEVLVTGGIYKYTRNPMYLSYLSIFLGEFMFLGHLSLLIYFFLMFIFINFYVINYEEPELKKRFGQKYTDYCKNVPRFIPR